MTESPGAAAAAAAHEAAPPLASRGGSTPSGAESCPRAVAAERLRSLVLLLGIASAVPAGLMIEPLLVAAVPQLLPMQHLLGPGLTRLAFYLACACAVLAAVMPVGWLLFRRGRTITAARRFELSLILTSVVQAPALLAAMAHLLGAAAAPVWGAAAISTIGVVALGLLILFGL